MAVNYRVYQNKRKGNFAGKYYARAAHKEVITLKDIAKTMQANSTVKYSDVMAVLTELSEVLKNELQRGNIVKLDGGEDFRNVLLCFFLWQTLQRRHVPHKPLDGEVRIKSRILRHEAELFAETDTHFQNVFGHAVVACIGYLTRVGFQVVGDDIHQR